MREVRAIREVGNDLRRDTPLDVGAAIAVALVADHGRHRAIGEHGAQCVRLEIEVESTMWCDHAKQRRLVGHFVEGTTTPGPRHRAQERRFILPACHAANIDAPHVAIGLHADRAKRNADLDAPPANKVGRARFPQSVPIRRGLFIGRDEIKERAQPIGGKAVAIAMIIEGVEYHRQMIVVVEIRCVATHVACNASLRMRFVKPGADVDELVVKKDPRLGAFGRGRTFVGLLLHEVRVRWRVAIHVFVNSAVELDCGGQARGAHRHLSRGVADHHAGCQRRLSDTRALVDALCNSDDWRCGGECHGDGEEDSRSDTGAQRWAGFVYR